MNIARISEQWELIKIFSEDGHSPIAIHKAKERLIKSILTHLWDCPTASCDIAYDFFSVESDMIHCLNFHEIPNELLERAVNFLTTEH